MSSLTAKRKKTTMQPKIHVKGARLSHDNEVSVKKEKRELPDDDDEDHETRGTSDEDDPVLEENSDGENDATSKKIKSKEERLAEKKAAKAKKVEKESEKNQRTIFIGNLPSTCEPRDLRKHFRDCGAIESVRLRGIIPSNPKMKKKAAAITKSIHETCKSIFGYVVFWDPENTTKIGDNYISVQRVGNKTFENDVSVFIGNLPLDVQENAIREFFAECGHIQGVRLIRDAKTGIGKGFGFVSFNARDGVILALEKSGAEFEGRDIRVMKAGREMQKKDNHSRKLDSKNARRRLRDSKVRDKNSDRSVADDEQEFSEADAEENGKNLSKEKKNKKNKKKVMFSGAKTGKSVTMKKKAKHKLHKVRQSAGKKRAIARLLTA